MNDEFRLLQTDVKALCQSLRYHLLAEVGGDLMNMLHACASLCQLKSEASYRRPCLQDCADGQANHRVFDGQKCLQIVVGRDLSLKKHVFCTYAKLLVKFTQHETVELAVAQYGDATTADVATYLLELGVSTITCESTGSPEGIESAFS